MNEIQKKEFRTLYAEYVCVELNPTRAATCACYCVGLSDELRRRAEQDNPTDTDPGINAYSRLIRSRESCFKTNTSSFENLLAVLTAVKNNGQKLSDNHTLSQISNFFGSFYAWCHDFQLDSPQSPSISSPSINFEFVTQFATLLTSTIAPDDLSNLFLRLKHLCEGIQKENLHRIEQLRGLAVILGMHELLSNDNDVFLETIRCVSGLDKKLKDIMITWIASIPKHIFEKLVADTQNVISFNVQKCVDEQNEQVRVSLLVDWASPTIRHGIGFISLCYAANCKRERSYFLLKSEVFDRLKVVEEPSDSPLPYKNFYNSTINLSAELISLDFNEYMQYTLNKRESLTFGLILNPAILNASTKATLLTSQAAMQQELEAQFAMMNILVSLGERRTPINVNTTLNLNIRRDRIVEDALSQLSRPLVNTNNQENTFGSSDLRKQLRVQFQGEAGVDEGGVRKEFFQLLVHDLFNEDYGMFTYLQEQRLFWFRKGSLAHEHEFELIGIILGLAMYNGVILDVKFPIAVYKKLLNLETTAMDLYEFEPSVVLSLRKILFSSQTELELMDLTFSVSSESFGVVEEHPLDESIKKDEPVTVQNRDQYCDLVSDWYLNKSIEQSFKAFARGFHRTSSELLMTLFRPEELILAIVGSDLIDFNALEESTQYQNGYTKDTPVVRMFWTFAHSLSLERKKKLLMFCTGSDRSPMSGLASLNFIVGKPGTETNRIPSAHTCFNYLLLPPYEDAETLAKYFEIALENTHGFGLL